MGERKTVTQIKHEIQVALMALRESDAALERGEASRARDVIRDTIVRLEGLLHEASQKRLRPWYPLPPASFADTPNIHNSRQ